MTPTTEFAAPAARASDAKVIGLVSAAHFLSHYYILVLAPLFPIIRADFNVSYTELGLALAAFNIVSGVLQTPAGFLVDRVGARAVLIGAVLIGAAVLALAAVLPFFVAFVAMFALLGVGNAVYHPADYALLSQHVKPARMGQAYAIHTFAGLLGGAAAPASLLLLTDAFGWRGAYLASAALGLLVALMLILFGEVLGSHGAPAAKKQEARQPDAGWRLLLAPAILLNLAFFVFIALASAGFQNYMVVVLQELWATPLALANAALSVSLVMGAVGVLLGGVVAMRTMRHDIVAYVGLTVQTLAVVALAFVDFDAVALIALLAVLGLFFGLYMPSRDLIVRSVTPPGAFGKVFGFVTTGFNIGGVIAPILFGWLIDSGNAQGVLLVTAVFGVLAIPTVTATMALRRRAASGA